MKQKHWGPFCFTFPQCQEVSLVSKRYINCFQFFSLFIFSFNTFYVKATSIFSMINLQIIAYVVREPVKKNCQKFSQFLCFSFSLHKMDAWLIIPLMIIVHHLYVYRAHLGTDTLTNLGLMSWKFVPDKIKIIQHYQSSNLGLKLEPLRTVHVGSAKRFLRILVSLKLLKSLMESVGFTFNVWKHCKSFFECFS